MELHLMDDSLFSSNESLNEINERGIPANDYLPYSNELESEARALFIEIRINLCKVVMLRELQPGCTFWCKRLHSYILIYGFKFSKEEQILLIKLLYELVTIPNIPSNLLEVFINTLNILWEKHSISREDLELPWKPLYELFKNVTTESCEKINMYQFFYGHTSNDLVDLCCLARSFFTLRATQEILDELRPGLYFYNENSEVFALHIMCQFLPVDLPPEHHGIGYKLWFDELMRILETTNKSTCRALVIKIMSVLAKNNIGYINWEPYIPLIFSKFMAPFEFPVYYKYVSNMNISVIAINSMAQWIVFAMDKTNSLLKYFKSFTNAVETYIHPANYGEWSSILKSFFSNLSHNLLTRLYIERIYKRLGNEPIPESHKLTDEQVDEFIKTLYPLVLNSIFVQTDDELCFTIKRLATIRPNLIIPEILRRLNSSLYSLTEPHELIILMNCMRAVARPMLRGSRTECTDYAFPSGPSLVMDILFSCLPGIDVNDNEKCLATLRLISAYALMVNIVDISSSNAELEDEEREICNMTSQFDNFITQFMDRIFALIISSSLDSVGRINSNTSQDEYVFTSMLANAISAILVNISDAILNTALEKLRDFIIENTFETKIAGQTLAEICYIFAKYRGEQTLKMIMPVLLEIIMKIIDDDDINIVENKEGRLPYALLLLNNITKTSGNNLMPYIDTLTNIIDKLLHMKMCTVVKRVHSLLRNIGTSLTNISLLYTTNISGYDINDPNYPHFRNWGQGTKLDSMNICWYTPGYEEIQLATKLFLKYFLPETVRLEKYIINPESLSKDNLQNSLSIILSLLKGNVNILPWWNEEPLAVKPTVALPTPMILNVGIKGEIKMPDGSNVRKYITNVMFKLQKVMFDYVEDDTRSFLCLLEIWLQILTNKSGQMTDYNQNYKSFKKLKKFYADKLLNENKHISVIWLKDVTLRQISRQLATFYPLTKTHSLIVIEIFKLAVSRYISVRVEAQEALCIAFGGITCGENILIPYILEILNKNPDEHIEQFKGVLYIIDNFLPSHTYQDDWMTFYRIIKAVALSSPSSNLFTQNFKDDIVNVVNNYNELLFNLIPMVPNSCITAAKQVWRTIRPKLEMPTETEIKEGLRRLEKLTKDNINFLNNMIDDLVDALSKTDMHWRNRRNALTIIKNSIHPKLKPSTRTIQCLLHILTNDSVFERYIAMETFMYIFRQFKRKHPKIQIDPMQFIGKNNTLKRSEECSSPGIRPDNQWLQYNSKTRPLTAEQWDEPRFVHSDSIGYYCWPKKLEIYAPSSRQPSFDPELRQLTEQEIEIDLFFSDPKNVKQMMEYHTLEETIDATHPTRILTMFYKGLFRNHGIAYLKHLVPHLKRMVEHPDEDGQCCGIRIIAGLIRGTKHWPFQMTIEFWDQVLPLIKTALRNVSTECMDVWIFYLQFSLLNRDPNTVHWLLECLMELPNETNNEASSVECAQLTIIQSAISERTWRHCEILNRLLVYVEDRLTAKPFHNLRTRLASLLTIIYGSNGFNRTSPNSPSVPDIRLFIDKVMPKIQELSQQFDAFNLNRNGKKGNREVNYVERLTKNEDLVRLFKTICDWICLSSTKYGPSIEFYQIYPYIYQFENIEVDEELAEKCSDCLSILSHTTIPKHHVPAIINIVKTVSKYSSWSIRVNSLLFLESFTFNNMILCLSNEEQINSARDIILELLEDEVIEVREKAASVLSGFLHCSLILNENELLSQMKKKADVKIKNGKNVSFSEMRVSSLQDLDKHALRVRHAGILGLSSFINAHPYDVPDYTPLIINIFNLHLNDPDPIPETIRKTLSNFKRTHCNNWRTHEQKFTENQLSALINLTIPPSYIL